MGSGGSMSTTDVSLAQKGSCSSGGPAKVKSSTYVESNNVASGKRSYQDIREFPGRLNLLILFSLDVVPTDRQRLDGRKGLLQGELHA